MRKIAKLFKEGSSREITNVKHIYMQFVNGESVDYSSEDFSHIEEDENVIRVFSDTSDQEMDYYKANMFACRFDLEPFDYQGGEVTNENT